MRLGQTRRWARIACCAWVLQTFGAILSAQMPAACKAPAELEKVIATQPSAGAYDALGAYFGLRQQLLCALTAFEAAVHQDPNSWEARFNLYLHSGDTKDGLRELLEAKKLTPADPDIDKAIRIAQTTQVKKDLPIESGVQR